MILLSVEIYHETVVHIEILGATRVVGRDETDDPEDQREEERAYRQDKAFYHPQDGDLHVVVGHLILL